jgi:N-acetylglucosaminyldiphosphoundecaprenol N-acetyl-beta-D-mannosaminyltransferase
VNGSAVELLGCRVDALDMEETIARCVRAIETREWLQHVCVNAAKFVELRRDPRLAAIVRDCELVSADGQSVVWASRLLRRPLPERVAGIDLMHRLLELAEEKGYGVFVLGARRHVVAEAVERVLERHPRLRVVGYRDGYFRDDENEAVCATIRDAHPDILFVAISSPRKEYWLAEHGPSLDVPFAMGVGGAIDVVAGVTARAPRWMQRSGLEWFFRFLQEPRRLALRYTLTNGKFIWLVLCELTRIHRVPVANSGLSDE